MKAYTETAAFLLAGYQMQPLIHQAEQRLCAAADSEGRGAAGGAAGGLLSPAPLKIIERPCNPMTQHDCSVATL